jgi:transposase
MKKRTYRTAAIQDIALPEVVKLLGSALEAIVAIDIAKQKMVFALASMAGQTLKLVRFEHPTQTRLFLALLDGLVAAGVRLEVVMESTGSYGDALRYQLASRSLPVFQVDPKRCHDASLVFDGVPSQHDAKACTILAELHARGISRRYEPRAAEEKKARALVDRHRMLMRPLEQLAGTLEALVATYWPELMPHLDLRARWHLELLAVFAGPLGVASDRDGARELLKRVTRGAMRPERIEEILRASVGSLGVPMSEDDVRLVHATVRPMLRLRDEVALLEKEADTFVSAQASSGVQSLARAIGTMTALALLGDVGDPKRYTSGATLQKALGLNLRERSSGEHQGKLRITKRGPARARQYLYFAALRYIQHDAVVRAWFAKRCKEGSKLRAVVAVMRKLVLALPHLARGAPFDSHKLFDVRRLELSVPALPAAS